MVDPIKPFHDINASDLDSYAKRMGLTRGAIRWTEDYCPLTISISCQIRPCESSALRAGFFLAIVRGIEWPTQVRPMVIPIRCCLSRYMSSLCKNPMRKALLRIRAPFLFGTAIIRPLRRCPGAGSN
jgi:hypothetical protein